MPKDSPPSEKDGFPLLLLLLLMLGTAEGGTGTAALGTGEAVLAETRGVVSCLCRMRNGLIGTPLPLLPDDPGFIPGEDPPTPTPTPASAEPPILIASSEGVPPELPAAAVLAPGRRGKALGVTPERSMAPHLTAPSPLAFALGAPGGECSDDDMDEDEVKEDADEVDGAATRPPPDGEQVMVVAREPL
jgi:hypothetical protein